MEQNMEMNLSLPTSPVSVAGAEVTHRAAGKGLPEQPPAEWVAAMAAKYGPMPISENARTVLERRYLKKDNQGDPVETPEGMVARVAYNIALADGLYYGAIPEVVLR